ncbi:ABC-three component system protein [Solimonas marina]|uniref:Alpha/beta hydrolase n=1 Tax=Solimonas marina TaxID=2714601 RepID=A0A970B7F8_9GAMM|nr:ABC-three component system protein [Solimonas marina]NKF23615.1 alpha/beta hydrolase [Solimonas marina]
MSEFVFKRVDSCSNPLIDLVFIHGLTGDANETWMCAKTKTFWPLWLSSDPGRIAIYTLGYSASMFDRWFKKEMDIFERSTAVLDYWAGLGLGNRPIAIVAHSLGGLLIKVLLRTAVDSSDQDYVRVGNATQLVIFLGTPHTGSYLAEVLSVIPGASKHVSFLANDTGFLQDLNHFYRRYAEQRRATLATRAYYEKYSTKSVTVVSRESADPGVVGVEPVPVDKDHISLCKPEGENDAIYLGIKRHVVKIVSAASEAERAVSVSDGEYVKPHESDRRDLLQKLIDAGREHEYTFANEAQNRFARRFIGSGLLTAAKDDHERLLGEVETRFVTHVFHALICKDRPDSEVREALQSQIVDALSSRKVGGTTFSAKDIVSALYYLTEQCYIRWDNPG